MANQSGLKTVPANALPNTFLEMKDAAVTTVRPVNSAFLDNNSAPSLTSEQQQEAWQTDFCSCFAQLQFNMVLIMPEIVTLSGLYLIIKLEHLGLHLTAVIPSE